VAAQYGPPVILKGQTKMLSIYTMANKFAPLSIKEEKEAVSKYFKTNCNDARQMLIMHNMRLVIKISQQFKIPPNKKEDLLQEGCIGILRGLDKFNPNKNVRLGYYLSWWIRAYMYKFVMKHGLAFKTGTTEAQRKLFFSMAKKRASLETLGLSVDDDSLAKELGVKPEEVRHMSSIFNNPTFSMDTVSEGHGISKHETIPDEDTIENHYETQDFQYKFRNIANKFKMKLSSKDRTVFERRILKPYPDALAMIGYDLSLTRERVRQLEVKLRDNFRKCLIRNKFTPNQAL